METSLEDGLSNGEKTGRERAVKLAALFGVFANGRAFQADLTLKHFSHFNVHEELLH